MKRSSLVRFGLPVVVAGSMFAFSSIPALAATKYSFDITVPAGGSVTYSNNETAPAGQMGGAEVQSEGNPFGGLGLPLHGNIVKVDHSNWSNSTSETLSVGYFEQMWKNTTGSSQKCCLALWETWDGIVSIEAHGYWIP